MLRDWSKKLLKELRTVIVDDISYTWDNVPVITFNGHSPISWQCISELIITSLSLFSCLLCCPSPTPAILSCEWRDTGKQKGTHGKLMSYNFIPSRFSSSGVFSLLWIFAHLKQCVAVSSFTHIEWYFHHNIRTTDTVFEIWIIYHPSYIMLLS